MTHLMKFNHIKLNHFSYHNSFFSFYHSLPFLLYHSFPFPIYHPSLSPLSPSFSLIPLSLYHFSSFSLSFYHHPFLPFYYPIPLPFYYPPLLPLQYSPSFPFYDPILIPLYSPSSFFYFISFFFIHLSKSQLNFYLNEKVEKSLLIISEKRLTLIHESLYVLPLS